MPYSTPLRDQALGKLFGFPSCCVAHYVAHGGRWYQGDFKGSGFVPCPACAMRTFDDVVSEIQSKRIYTTPFPSDLSEGELRAVLEDPRFSGEERACLQADVMRLASVNASDPLPALRTLLTRVADIEKRRIRDSGKDPSRGHIAHARAEIEIKRLCVRFLEEAYGLFQQRRT